MNYFQRQLDRFLKSEYDPYHDAKESWEQYRWEKENL